MSSVIIVGSRPSIRRIVSLRAWSAALALVFVAQAACADPAAQLTHVAFIDNSLATGVIPAQPVHDFQQPADPSGAGDAGQIEIDPTQRHQTMVGVGAAFSEIGTLAFLALSRDQQADIVGDLFDPKTGAGFQMCRLPVGSSDFATSAYSYDDKPDDYEMNAFTLARDEASIIPVVRQAIKANPSMMLFASPWSPPGWMKPIGRMDHGGNEHNRLIDDPKIFKAYALYFQKYLQGYLADGIFISRLCPQNEMDLSPGYPGCVVPPEVMTRLVADYLAPEFKSAGIKTELWPGTFRENPKVPWAQTCLENEAFRSVIVGLGVQYCSSKSIAAIAAGYPKLRFMFTEANCCGGKNTAQEAQGRLGEMISAFGMGCDAWAYWNMMLDEKQKSGWGWKQNSLLTIDRAAKTVRYNADFQPVCLVSRSIRPGDVWIDEHYHQGKVLRLETSGAFVRPDGSVQVLAQNRNDSAVRVSIKVGSAKALSVILPAHSDDVISVSMQ